MRVTSSPISQQGRDMRLPPTLVLAFGAALLPSVASAGVEDVSPALREQAEAVCREDAMRLCADAIPDETAIIACMGPSENY